MDKTQKKGVRPRSSLNEAQPETSTSNQTNVDQQLLKRKLPSDFPKAMGVTTQKKRPTRVETTPFTIKEVSKSTYSDGISDTTFEVKLSNDYFWFATFQYSSGFTQNVGPGNMRYQKWIFAK